MTNPVNTMTDDLFNIHFDIIFPFLLVFLQQSLAMQNSETYIHSQDAQGVKVNTSGFSSRASSDSEISVQYEVSVNMLLSYGKYVDMHFVCGFATVTPPMHMKSVGNDILGDESPVDVCSLRFSNT